MPFDPGIETGYLRRATRDHDLDPGLGAHPFDPGAGAGYDDRRARKDEKRRAREERAAGSESGRHERNATAACVLIAEVRSPTAAGTAAAAAAEPEPLIELDEPAEVETGGPAPVTELRGLRPRRRSLVKRSSANAPNASARSASAAPWSSASESSESVRIASGGATPARARGTPAARSRGVAEKRREQGRRQAPEKASRPVSVAPRPMRVGRHARTVRRRDLVWPTAKAGIAVSLVLGLTAARIAAQGFPFPASIRARARAHW